MSARHFPTFARHVDAVCPLCDAPCGKQRHRETDYPNGQGRYVMRCPKCERQYWYDIKPRLPA